MMFTKYFIKPIHAFITMSEKVAKDVRQLTDKPVRTVAHPLYDNFGSIISMPEARRGLKLDQSERIVLFFGFIREYKGLDLLLEAMAMLKDRLPKENKKMPKLLIAGEFYENRKKYDAIIENLRLRDTVILHTDFIPDSQVRNYFCAADVVVQPYRNATQSGVTPLAYHFEVPMIVTNVGGLPALVPHEKVGLVCEPTAASIADTLHRYFIMGREQFLPGLIEEKGKYSWGKLTEAILSF